MPFWLIFTSLKGLPQRFCRSHLPKSTVSMVLEDEDGNEYDAVFISERTGLSGGWRAFALEHKLDDGDALIFELVERTRFKVRHLLRLILVYLLLSTNTIWIQIFGMISATCICSWSNG